MDMVVFWAVVGLLLIGAEVFTGGFGIFWFGLAAFGASGMAALGAGLPSQVLALALGGLVLFTLTRPLTLRWHTGRPVATNARALIGQVGVVTQPIAGPKEPGYVRLNGEEWRAAAPIPLGPGAKVIVRSITGATLQVEAAGGHHTKEDLLG